MVYKERPLSKKTYLLVSIACYKGIGVVSALVITPVDAQLNTHSTLAFSCSLLCVCMRRTKTTGGKGWMLINTPCNDPVLSVDIAHMVLMYKQCSCINGLL